MIPDPFICQPLTQDHYLSPLNAAYHQEDSFREQMGVLYMAGMNETHVTLLRTFLTVGEPGSVSLDPKNPGHDTPEAWEEIDDLIEDHEAVGTFHTHPPAVLNFSSQDHLAQNGLAKVFGSKMLWHGMQSCSGEGFIINGSRFVCCYMLGDRVFRFTYEMIEDDLKNPVVKLPLPPVFGHSGCIYEIEMSKLQLDS